MSDTLLLLIILAALAAAFLLWRIRSVTTIYPPNVGLLYRDGRFQRELGPGRYVFFDPLRRVRIVKVSKAPLPVPLGERPVFLPDRIVAGH